MKQKGAISDVSYHLSEDQVLQIVEYFKRKYLEQPKGKGALAYYRSWGLTLVLYYSSRRISEVLGQKPYIRLPGIQPEHINFEKRYIKYHIAKKNSVRSLKRIQMKTKVVYEKLRPEDVALMKADKKAHIEILPATDRVLTILKKMIEVLDIKEGQRVFKFSRTGYDAKLKEACSYLHITVSGTRSVRFLESRNYKYDRNGKIKVVGNQPLYQYEWSYKVIPKKIGAHIFRHSFAMNYCKVNEKDPLVLQKLQRILCHSSLEQTQPYLSATNEDLRESMENLSLSK